MPIKPDADTGWSKAEPQVDGVYWWRVNESDNEPQIISITANRMFYYEIGAAQPLRFEDFDGEWLGPISPSDFEQLIRLQKATSVALSFIEPILNGITSPPQPRDGILSIVESFSDGSYWNHATLNVEDLNDAVAALREALGDPK